MGPWRPPAKNARIGRREGDGPPIIPVKKPVWRLISGKETSFDGLKPSDVLALQSTLMEFLYKWGTDLDASGPCDQTTIKRRTEKHC